MLDIEIGTPDKLFWQERGGKGKKRKITFPVRACPLDEIVGLALRPTKKMNVKDVTANWDDEKVCPIQDIQYPHPIMKDVGQYDKVSKKNLTPYWGDGEAKDNWCQKRLELYLKYLKQMKGFGLVECKTEELYLERVLRKSFIEEEKKNELMELDQVTSEVDTKLSGNSFDRKGSRSADSDSGDDEESMPCLRFNRGQKTDSLRCGDIIAFYKPPYGAGDQRGYCEAKIIYINPKGKQILEIDEFFVNLQPDHQVKRIKRNYRGKLVDHHGKFRPINEYILKKEGGSNAMNRGFKKEKTRVDGIIQKAKEIIKSKLDKDEFGPRDLLR